MAELREYEGLAAAVVRKSLRIRPGENVIVECWNHGLDIAREVVYQLRSVAARPMLLFEDEDAYWRSVSTLPSSKLGHVGSHEWKALAEADAYIFVPGPADIMKIREFGIDRYNAMTTYNDEWYRRAERARIRGVRIGLGYVTAQRAAAYGFDLKDWRRMMLEASSVDPLAISRVGRRVAAALSKEGHVEITAPNGTQFACDLMGRKARIEEGRATPEAIDRGDVMTNLPAGEAYVTPDEKSGEGTIVFDRPVASLGRWIRGVTLGFDGGRLTKFSASENEASIRSQWDRAKGDRDRIGLIDIGLNPKARTGFLHDYIVAGNVYLGVGSNDDDGGKNKTSFSLGSTLTGATVKVDGRTIVREGSLAL